MPVLILHARSTRRRAPRQSALHTRTCLTARQRTYDLHSREQRETHPTLVCSWLPYKDGLLWFNCSIAIDQSSHCHPQPYKTAARPIPHLALDPPADTARQDLHENLTWKTYLQGIGNVRKTEHSRLAQKCQVKVPRGRDARLRLRYVAV